jgi:hypothetical protein
LRWHESLTGEFCPGSLVKVKSRERNGAFGLAARAGDRGADQRAGQKAEWSGGFEVFARERHRGSEVSGICKALSEGKTANPAVLATGGLKSGRAAWHFIKNPRNSLVFNKLYIRCRR